MSTYKYVSVLPKELAEAINEEKQKAEKLLDIKPIDAPKKVVEKITEYISSYLLQNQENAEETQAMAITLGCLWGDAVIREYGWYWMHLGSSPEDAGVYVVSPKKYYCCPSLFFLNKIMQGNNAGFDGENDNTVLLLFNMLKGIENKKPSEEYTTLS